MPRIIVLVSSNKEDYPSDEEIAIVSSKLHYIISQELNSEAVNDLYFVSKTKENIFDVSLVLRLNGIYSQTSYIEQLDNKIQINDQIFIEQISEGDVIFSLDSFVVGQSVFVTQEITLNQEHENLVAQLESLLIEEEQYDLSQTPHRQEFQENNNTISNILCLPFWSQTYDNLESTAAKAAYTIFYLLLLGWLILLIAVPIKNHFTKEEEEVPLKRNRLTCK